MNQDGLWTAITQQAEQQAVKLPSLRHYLTQRVFGHADFTSAMADLLSQVVRRLDTALPDLSAEFSRIMSHHPAIVGAAIADLERITGINPDICPDHLTGFLSFRGFQAIQLHRIAHGCWNAGERHLALLLQNWTSHAFSVDIHPAARIAGGVFVDHGIGIVIGETAVVEEGVSMWHGVTLGATLRESGDRHPKIRRGVIIGAGATILGNIEIGEGAVIAAASLVREAVPPGRVAAGVPAKVVGRAGAKFDAINPAANRQPGG